MVYNELTVKYASEQIRAATGYMPREELNEGGIVYMCQDTSDGKDAGGTAIFLLRYRSVLEANIRNAQGA